MQINILTITQIKIWVNKLKRSNNIATVLVNNNVRKTASVNLLIRETLKILRNESPITTTIIKKASKAKNPAYKFSKGEKNNKNPRQL